MSYIGAATLICEDGREIAVQAHLEVNSSGPLVRWAGRLTAQAESALLGAAGNGQIRLPDGRTGDVIIAKVRGGNHAEIIGSGDPPTS